MNANSQTTINDWLNFARPKLKLANITTSDLDCIILLENATKLNRALLLAHKDTELSKETLNHLNNHLERRFNREPLAYITNQKEFYNRCFYVDSNVLIPRPESESFINLLKKHGLNTGTLIDVGTGSGILGISAKLEFPKLTITLSDISEQALRVSKLNAKTHDADVEFKLQSLLNEYYDIVLANLPYVPNDILVEKELSYEPRDALFAQNNGLEIYSKFCTKISLFKPSIVLTESLLIQHSYLTNMLKTAGYKLVDSENLVQLFELKSN